MERSCTLAKSGSQKCHYSQGETNNSVFHHQKCHPCYGQTICAETVSFVVVGLACTACIFLLSNFVASHDFSPNALKHIVCENQAGSWEQDENAKNARGVWFSNQFGTFWASSSRTGFCKNLLIALVFSLLLDNQGLFWWLLLWSGP